MATFTPRLTAPSESDLNWIKTTHGGYNYCIEISNGSVLPNCVGYAWGRWREILGSYHNLSRGNGGVWWGNTSDGYERGQVPKLGAVACWGGTYGHVAIVEQINDDGSIVTSNSSADVPSTDVDDGIYFYLSTRSYPYASSGLTFQGFIYLPIEFDGGGTVNPNTFTVTTSYEPSGAGYVTGAGTYSNGTTAILTAVANEGYKFLKWSDGYENPERWITDYTCNCHAIFVKTTPTVWIYGNRYLNENEMQNNAMMTFNYLIKKGWTFNAIAGLLGNMESESTINPAIWQSLNEGNYSGGYGLVQWTPATNYIDWANALGYDITDGDAQLKWIDEVTVIWGQWLQTDEYPISFDEFKTSSKTPEYLASAFLKNFERAGVEVEENRRTQARKWYAYLLNHGEIIIPSTTKKKRKFNFILFNQKRRSTWKGKNF